MSVSTLLDVVMTHPVSGKATGLERCAARAIKALESARIPYCVIGAAALGARGLPRFTWDLDVTISTENSDDAIKALRKAGFIAMTPADEEGEAEAMIVFADPASKIEIDLLVAQGNPELLAIEEASRAKVFGVSARVATLEHLLLLYLYSNQPKHIGDFAAIAQSGLADMKKAQAMLADIHPEMISQFRKRVKQALHPPPAPERPKLRGK